MSRLSILGELWLRYKPNYPRLVTGEVTSNDEFWSEFFAYNDLGLPLAYAAAENLIELDQDGERYIDETYSLLCGLLGVDSDEQFDDLESLFIASPYVRFEE